MEDLELKQSYRGDHIHLRFSLVAQILYTQVMTHDALDALDTLDKSSL